MLASSREEIGAVFKALEAGFKRAAGLSFEPLSTPERLALLQRWEALRRLLPVVEHPLIDQIAEQADATELGGKLPWALANRPRISEVMADHVHLFVRVGPRVLRAEYRAKVLWSPSYFAASVGYVSDSTVRQDIEHQWDGVA
jgi:hypothetical protein